MAEGLDGDEPLLTDGARIRLKGKGGTWTYDDLNKFLANPKAFVPGTAMGFAGIAKDSERADVIAYLNSLSEKPAPLPTAAK